MGLILTLTMIVSNSRYKKRVKEMHNNKGSADPMTLITLACLVMFRWYFYPMIWSPKPAYTIEQVKQQARQIAELLVLVP